MGPMHFLTEEEKQNMPKVTKALLARIMSYLKPYWLQFIFVFIAILLSATVGLFPSIITGRIVDEALVGKNMELLIKLLLAAFAALTVSQLVGVLENYINAWISQRIIFDMRNQMYKHLQYMPHSFFTTEKQGDIITRMNTDISGVSSVISGTLSNIVSNVATVITTLVALFSMSAPLALVGIAVIPLLVLPTRTAGRTRWKYLTQSQAKSDELNQKIDETLSVSGSMLVKIFTREQKEYDDFVKVNKEVTDLNLKEQRSGQLFRVVMGMFTQLGPLLIYFAGGYFIIRQIDTSLTVGVITATVALINRLYRPIEQLMNISVDFTRSLALFTRIFDYFDRENTIVSPENGQKPDVDNKPITYEHVAFSYNPENPILRDVNFEVPGGSMYAIVGPSGSGKSTVVNLIPRLYDVCGGSVKIAGVDVRDFDLTYLREQIGVVTQESYLFNGTILENLRYAKDDATMEEIEEACRIANIHEFISSQPDGYNTEVGNRGLKLSGGEKQRLSLARVILKDPKILILDEATSALDSISENSIQDALEQMMMGRTSIVIAHRLSTILKADRILVVKDGVIAEQGTHEELLELGGTYKELYETQFRQAIDSENFRKAESRDIPAIEKIYDHTHDAEEAGNTTTGWKRGIYPTLHTAEDSLERGDMYVAEIGGEVVATGIINKIQVDVYADVDWKYEAPDDKVAVLHTLAVEPDARGKGIGRSFVKFYEDLARERGCEVLRIDTNARNAAARKMYKSLGYTESGIVPTVFNGIKNVDLVMLEKKL